MLYQLSYVRVFAHRNGAHPGDRPGSPQESRGRGIFASMDSFGGQVRQNALWGRGGRRRLR